MLAVHESHHFLIRNGDVIEGHREVNEQDEIYTQIYTPCFE